MIVQWQYSTLTARVWALQASALAHLKDLLIVLAGLGPIQRLHETQPLLEPLATIVFTAFQAAPLDFSPEGLRVVFEVFAGALLPAEQGGSISNGNANADASGPVDGAASGTAHAMLHLFTSTFCRRDLARCGTCFSETFTAD